jgi:hypothetical protein
VGVRRLSGQPFLDCCCQVPAALNWSLALTAGRQPQLLCRNRTLSEQYGNDRIDFLRVDEGEDCPQPRLKLCPAWSSTEGIETGEFIAELSQTVVALIPTGKPQT